MEQAAEQYARFDPRTWPPHTRGSADSIPPDCPECGQGDGWISEVTPDHPQGLARPCPTCERRFVAERIERIRNSTNVPSRSLGCTFDNYDLGLFPETKMASASRTERASAAAALAAARQFAAGQGPSILLLLSVPGTGKTHLAAAVAATVAERGIPIWYLAASEFGERARAFDQGEEGGASFVAQMQAVPVLILDDVGVEHDPRGYLTTVYHAVIDRRYANELRTMLISNLNEADLMRRLGDRVVDRLVERGTGISVVIEARSVRDRLPT